MDTDSNHDAEEDFEDELSLDRLSEAYAEVIRQQANPDAADEGQSRGELVANKIARDKADQDGDGDDEADQAQTTADEADDNSACPITPESIIESILFVGTPRGEKLTSKQIASVMRDVSPKEVLAVAKQLNEKYEQEDAAYRIKTESDSIRMVIADDLLGFQNEYYGRNREVSLSQSAIDILAVVAYRQPISRDGIEKARNKPVGGVLKQLIRRDLLTTVPDADQPKRKLYRTTQRFLELFHLSELEDLPQSHDVSDVEDFE